MGLTLGDLKRLVEGEGLKYFVDPLAPRLLIGMKGMSGSYQFMVAVHNDPDFLQFRTVNYLSCPADSPHTATLLRVLASLNYQLRFIKYAWDESDGEVVLYGDMWVLDSEVTQTQFRAMMQNYVSALDVNHLRVRRAVESGEDPGAEDPGAMLERMLGEAGTLPPELKELLDKIKKGKGEEGSDEDDFSTV